MICLGIPSFYPGGDGAYGILGSIGGRIRLDGAPTNCQHWNNPSTSRSIEVLKDMSGRALE